jgi:hypothetical protein
MVTWRLLWFDVLSCSSSPLVSLGCSVERADDGSAMDSTILVVSELVYGSCAQSSVHSSAHHANPQIPLDRIWL